MKKKDAEGEKCCIEKRLVHRDGDTQTIEKKNRYVCMRNGNSMIIYVCLKNVSSVALSLTSPGQTSLDHPAVRHRR